MIVESLDVNHHVDYSAVMVDAAFLGVAVVVVHLDATGIAPWKYVEVLVVSVVHVEADLRIITTMIVINLLQLLLVLSLSVVGVLHQ